MSLLCDEVIAAVGSERDEMSLGTIGSVARHLARAERFVFSDELAKASEHVAYAAPSSLLDAIKFARPSFPTMWIEFRPEDNGTHLLKPVPRRIGYLLQEIGAAVSCTMLWSHRGDGVAFCPLGFVLSYEEDAQDALKNVVRSAFKGTDAPQELLHSIEKLRKQPEILSSLHGSELDRLSSRDLDALWSIERRVVSGPTYHAIRFIDAVERLHGRHGLTRFWQEWGSDLAGEANRVVAFLVLLNSRNATEEVTEDREKLNRARAKSRKRPLLSHRVVDLRLSAARRRVGKTSGLSAHDIRSHLVRGHFKVRKTGVFWWSPYVRGAGPGEVAHARYEVAA